MKSSTGKHDMSDREKKASFDILVIGGGINGCGIARDAAGRGYSVCLAEMNDLASGTSSWSTKLIHGGLRYLEYYEFRLVREALMERETLWAMAPHIVRPLRFILPHHRGLRPALLIRLGLFLYDHIGGRMRLPATRTLDLVRDAAGAPLKPLFEKGFEYSDCWVDDARLVILNAVDAAETGADIRVRTKVAKVERRGDIWRATLHDRETGERSDIEARIVVNAAGPWVDAVLSDAVGEEKPHNVRMVQGSHIIVHKLFDHDRCYIFQNADDRIVFAIPYEDDYTLIGTTDRDYDGDPADVKITTEEIDYLCNAASEYFKKPVTPADIAWTYSGVRPLYDDGASKAQAATRDYTLKLDEGRPGEAALINIFGGKITTYRKLAEAVIEIVGSRIGAKQQPWTKGAVLPGGDFSTHGFDALAARIRAAHPFLSEKTATRLARAYGTRALSFLQGAVSPADMGEDFSGENDACLYAREVDYLIATEWARTADDILWRRSKLGLRIKGENVERLQRYIEERRQA